MGDVDAQYQLSRFYADMKGDGEEWFRLYMKGKGCGNDEKKEFYHFEEAANRGHHQARLLLSFKELNNKRFGREQ